MTASDPPSVREVAGDEAVEDAALEDLQAIEREALARERRLRRELLDARDELRATSERLESWADSLEVLAPGIAVGMRERASAAGALLERTTP